MSRTTSRSARAINVAFLRWGFTLALALAIEVVLAVRSTLDSVTSTTATELVLLVVAAVAAVALVSSYYELRRTLYQREQAIEAASATSADWLWETDSAGLVTYSSEGVRALLGYEPSDVVGRMAQDLLAPQAREQERALLPRSIDRKVGWDPIELPWLHAEGHVVTLQGAAVPILDERGNVTGFRGTRRRLTAAMLSERELAAARKRIHAVLAEDAVDMALQPIIDFPTGRIAGVEALVRFRDGRAPDIWFRDAVDAGLGIDLDRLTFTHALAAFRDVPVPCYLSINATPELLNDPRFQRRILAPDIPADRLVLEITEHERVASYEELGAALAPLRERGVRLAVDDTGAGYASLNHVLQLRPDIIKLDRSLVSHVTTDPARRALVTALVLLASELGSAVTAEGIETPRELETLAHLGVDHAQGFLLARPTTDRNDWAAWWNRDWLPEDLRVAGR